MSINWYDPVVGAYREITFDDALLMLRTLGFTIKEAEVRLKTNRLGKPLPAVKARRGVFRIFRGTK